jgi:hypothetical protein
MSLFDKISKKKPKEETDMVKLLYKSHLLEDFLDNLSKDARLSKEERKEITDFKNCFEDSHKSAIALLSGDAERWDELFAKGWKRIDLISLNQKDKKEKNFPEIIAEIKKKITKEEGKLLDFVNAAHERETELEIGFILGIKDGKWKANFKTRPLSDFTDKYTVEKLKQKDLLEKTKEMPKGK